ncbi:MAG: glycosyl hydrolase family 28-related protein [Candidatus Fervidibacter sp.]|uniref:glycosyl hydrolase family 28-related protein n=1 Tax=Candidatus Fervidibacter sp. TaxID=3100871 RepID=UPI00404B4F4E
MNIPAGKVKVVELPADMSFLKEKVDIPGKVFDAKRDFGARGDGKTDDTRAIQKTIDSARKWRRGAIAYLPVGDYVITKTIKITGSDYYIGGCGSQTNIIWQGEEEGIMFHIHDPNHIVLENLSMGWKNVDTKEGLNILQTSSGKPSLMIYDGVYVYGMYQDKPGVKGLQLRGLSKDSTVIIRHLCGNLRITDSSQACILVNASYNGNLLLEGKEKMRDGLIGFLTRFTPDKPYTLYIRDNQSLVMSDYYVEQGEQYAIFEGGEDDPPGYVVIQGAKIHCWGKYSKSTIVVSDYKGMILLGHNQFYAEPKPLVISIGGNRPCELVLLGVEWYSTEPAVNKTPSSQARVYAFGCEVKSWKRATDKPMEEKLKEIFDVPKESTLEKVALGLDKLRLLGELDLKLNHPTVWNILQRQGCR